MQKQSMWGFRLMLAGLAILVAPAAALSSDGSFASAIPALRSGELDARTFDFGEIYHRGEEADKLALEKFFEAISEEVDNLMTSAKAAAPEGRLAWSTSRILCFDARIPKTIKAAITLARSSKSYDEWAADRGMVLELFEKAMSREIEWSKRDEAAASDNIVARKLGFLYGAQQGLVSVWTTEENGHLSLNARIYFGEIQMHERCRNSFESLPILKDIFDNHGWPKRSVYGKDADNNAFFVLHNTGDLEMLERGLSLMRDLYPVGEASSIQYANLYDIIARFKGNRQRYGTVILCKDGIYQHVPEVEDPETLSERRAKFGLSTMEERFADFPASCRF